MLQLLQFLGNKPFGVGGGLAADPVRRDQPRLGFRHLDVVAEHFVEPNFKVFDARLFLRPLLQVHDHVAPVGDDVAQPVHLRVKAVPDKLPLPDGEGRFVHQPLNQLLPELGQIVQLLPEALEQGAFAPRQQLPQPGQLSQPRRQRRQVPASGGAVDHAANEPFQVGDLPQGGG